MTKFTHQEATPKSKDDGFPKLMKHIHTGTIALFKDENLGTTLIAKAGTPPGGQHTPYNGLNPHNWEPFYGSVTITSEP